MCVTNECTTSLMIRVQIASNLNRGWRGRPHHSIEAHVLETSRCRRVQAGWRGPLVARTACLHESLYVDRVPGAARCCVKCGSAPG
jgi:hypothetical protein